MVHRPQRSRKAAKAIFVLRAMFVAPPGREKKAARKAERRFKIAYPKHSRAWMTI